MPNDLLVPFVPYCCRYWFARRLLWTAAVPVYAQDWNIHPRIAVGGELDDNSQLSTRTDDIVDLEGYLIEVSADITYDSDATQFLFTSATGTATYSIAVPNSTSYIGIELFHQWAVFDAVNPLGIVVSDAGMARLGN